MRQRHPECPAKSRLFPRFQPVALAALAAGLTLSQGAAAQSWPLTPTWTMRVGAFFPDIDTKASAKLNDNSFATTVDFESDVGLADSKTLPVLDLGWRFAPRHRLEFNYIDLKRDATTRISSSITWEDVTFPVSATVRGQFDSTFAAVNYLYSVYQTPDAELSAGLGLHYTTLKAGLFGEGNNLALSREVSANAPLPVVIFRGAARFTESIGGEMRYQWFGVKYGDYDGSLNLFTAGVSWFPWKNVGFEAGYNYSRYDLKVDKESWRGSAKYTFKGPTLNLLVAF